ncbi:MAG: insulinase family protein [Bacteroidetes bacterium]|nr:insulinase family protein [Bacteroidota bacterium]
MYHEQTTHAKNHKGATVVVVNKSGAVQSVVDVTYPIDMKQGHPDEIKLKVANGILGGGSTGRLFQSLREKHAWTYHILFFVPI